MPTVLEHVQPPPKVAALGLTAGELDAAVQHLGWPRFRAQQVREWVFTRGVLDPEKMTNLSKRDRLQLADRFDFGSATAAARHASTDGTLKLLLEWPAALPGGKPAVAETVMIPDGDRRTACVSSQVGCPVGCTFCASGIDGTSGNLTAAQIVEQVVRLNEQLQPAGHRITNVVFMGMGEPLANYAQLMQAVRVLHDPAGLNIGARRITISTVGVPARMRQLADEQLPLNLAISLHAPNEPLRRQLIPWAEHFALSDILSAARHYFDVTGREITLEYILLAGVNDSPHHAAELARLCRTLRANVNLIRYNEVPGLPYGRPAAEDVMRFQTILRNAGVNAHVRKKPRPRHRRRLRAIEASERDGSGSRAARGVDRFAIMLSGPLSLRERVRVRVIRWAESRSTLENHPHPHPAHRRCLPEGEGTRGRYPSRHGLSLVELIVSTAILLILLSIFVPYLLKVREQNNRSRCADNLRLLGGAMADYAARNGGNYPRVGYNPAVAPAGYTAFTGPDTARPFARGSPVSHNDVTASLWLLVRLKLAEPADFICPSTTDLPDSLLDAHGRPVPVDQRGNFRGPASLSFSYACPFGDAPGYRLNDTRRAGFALMADRAPNLALASVVPASTAGPLELAAANSPNHGRAGQNVLYAQGDVEFESTAYCGIDHDNIYTAATRAPAGKPLGAPADEVGAQGVNLSPGNATDSFLVPAAGDPVGVMIASELPPPPPRITPPATRTAPPVIPPTTRPSTRPIVRPPLIPATRPATLSATRSTTRSGGLRAHAAAAPTACPSPRHAPVADDRPGLTRFAGVLILPPRECRPPTCRDRGEQELACRQAPGRFCEKRVCDRPLAAWRLGRSRPG